MNILIFMHTQYSHVSATKNFVTLLTKYHKVSVYLPKEHSHLLDGLDVERYYYPDIIKEKNRIISLDYSNYLGGVGTDRKINNIAEIVEEETALYEYMLRTTFVYYDNIKETVYEINPDLIIRDSCCLFGRLFANKLGVPIMGYTTSPIITSDQVEHYKRKYLELVFNLDLSTYSEIDIIEIYNKIISGFSNISDKYGIESYPINYLINSDEMYNFSFGLPNQKELSSIPDNYIYLKPKLFESERSICNNDESIIYISSGTVLTFPINIINSLINAFKNSTKKVIMTFKYVNSDFININMLPNNFNIQKFVNQKSILQNSFLFVSHGGYNSLLETVYYGIPIIVIPIASDQFLNGQFAEEHCIGICISKKNADSQHIKEATNFIKEHYSMYKKSLDEVYNLICKLPSTDVINDIVERCYNEYISN